MLALDHVRLRYGPTVVLDDVSFDVAPGEVVGLLGPNGAGKSSALRVLLALTAAEHGRVDRPATVGYLPEDHRGNDTLTVDGYLGYLAAMKAVDRRARRAEVRRVAERAGIAELGRRPMGRLSKGQRQRVGIAQALLGDPEAVVFDEPTAALDPAQVGAFRDLARDLADGGAAVLLSTHLLAEAAAVCDRIVVLVRGRVAAIEPPGELERLERRFLDLAVDPGSA